jgi:16S rRNA (adenine1518-N6/adenine1519-N6)-dimethyltransferase
VKHKARRRFGQHFLESAWADKVVAAIQPRPEDRFLEIGPGPGILTSRLIRRVASLTAVEIDRDLAEAIAAEQPGVNLIVGDFLEMDLSPLVAEGPLRIAGNLPYNISSPILFRLLAAARQSPNLVDATVMLQREVAERLAARVGTKDYGVLTVFAQAQAEVTRLLILPPGAFRPAPKVESAVVRLAFKPPAVPPELTATFERLVRTVFMQRRKTLSNALRPVADAAGLDTRALLTTSGIDPIRRPETLAVADLVALAGRLRKA